MKNIVYMGPFARVDYNITLCRLQSRLQYMYHGQPYARVDLNPVPESTGIPPVRDLRFGLCTRNQCTLMNITNIGGDYSLYLDILKRPRSDSYTRAIYEKLIPYLRL